MGFQMNEKKKIIKSTPRNVNIKFKNNLVEDTVSMIFQRENVDQVQLLLISQ